LIVYTNSLTRNPKPLLIKRYYQFKFQAS
jgi:hypothetical protein